jgi:hypothetical protein
MRRARFPRLCVVKVDRLIINHVQNFHGPVGTVHAHARSSADAQEPKADAFSGKAKALPRRCAEGLKDCVVAMAPLLDAIVRLFLTKPLP